MESTLAVKQRFGIIGDNPILNRAIEKSIQVANSDISVLVTGESGVGKENIPKIIHQYSHRKSEVTKNPLLAPKSRRRRKRIAELNQ